MIRHPSHRLSSNSIPFGEGISAAIAVAATSMATRWFRWWLFIYWIADEILSGGMACDAPFCRSNAVGTDIAIWLDMKSNTNKQMNQCFLPRRSIVMIFSFLLVGNLSPYGMRVLDCLNVESPLSDIVLLTVLFAGTGMVYCILRHMCPTNGRRSDEKTTT